MKLSILNLKLEKVGDYTVPSVISDYQGSAQTIAQAVRVFQGNQRSAHAKAKERSQVSGTTKKMWAQKGTGRARHGSAKAPQFVGGGKAHGPSGLQNYHLRLPQRMAKSAIKALLAQKLADKQITLLDKITSLTPIKTKTGQGFITLLATHLKDNKSPKYAIITARSQPDIDRIFRNLPGIHLIRSASLHPYLLLTHRHLVFTRAGFNQLIKRLS